MSRECNCAGDERCPHLDALPASKGLYLKPGQRERKSRKKKTNIAQNVKTSADSVTKDTLTSSEEPAHGAVETRPGIPSMYVKVDFLGVKDGNINVQVSLWNGEFQLLKMFPVEEIEVTGAFTLGLKL